MPPPNDTRAGATAISLATPRSTLAANTTNAVNNTAGSCACTSGRDVFFSFTLAQREIVYADTIGATWNTSLFLQDSAGANIAATGLPMGGSTCNDNGGLTGCALPVAPGVSQIMANLPAGTYYLVLSGCGLGVANINFQHLPVGNGPLAFLPAGVNLVVGGATAGVGVTSGACAGAGPENGYYWWSCPAYAGGTFNATTCTRAAWDTVLYQRSAARATFEVCNDDACALQSTISATGATAVPAGAGIHTFHVDGFSAAALGAYTTLYTRP